MPGLQMLQGCESDMYALKVNLKCEHVFFSTWWIHSTYVLSFLPFQSGAPGRPAVESAESQLTLTGRSCVKLGYEVAECHKTSFRL